MPSFIPKYLFLKLMILFSIQRVSLALRAEAPFPLLPPNLLITQTVTGELLTNSSFFLP
jgi:hypothetical protein